MEPQATDADKSQIETKKIAEYGVVTTWYAPLLQITPTSRIVVAIVMIMLPFVGGFVGWELAKVNYKVNEITEYQDIQSNVVKENIFKSTLWLEKISVMDCDYCGDDVYYNIPVIEKTLFDGEVVGSSTTPFMDVSDGYIIALEKELMRDEKRFLGDGWYFDAPSDYLITSDGIYYRPLNKNGEVMTDIKLASEIKESYALSSVILFANNKLYYKGSMIGGASFAKSVYPAGILLVTEDSVYSEYEDNRSSSLKKVFTGVDGVSFKIKPELDYENASFLGKGPSADGGYLPRWFTDESNFYCLNSSTENPIELTEPIEVRFQAIVGGENDTGETWIDENQSQFLLTFISTNDNLVYDQNCQLIQ